MSDNYVDIENKKKPKNEEKETVIIINDGETTIYSSDIRIIKKIIKYMKDFDNVSVLHDDIYGTKFSVPKDWIKIKPHKKRIYTEEELSAKKARMKEVLANLRRKDNE